jgi:hypothetical protein
MSIWIVLMLLLMLMGTVPVSVKAEALDRPLAAPGDFTWAKGIGGIGDDVAGSIVTDSSGYLYTTGEFSSTVDFDPGAGTSNLVSNGEYDAFISKMDSSGNFVWAKGFGGSGVDMAHGVAVDSSGNVYAVGKFSGTVDFDPGVGVTNLTSMGGYDIFVIKLDSSGNLAWAKSIGGTSDDVANAVSVGPDGSVVFTGNFQFVADFDPGTAVSNLTSAGNHDLFISNLSSSGSFVWAKSIGASSSESGASIYVDSAGNIYTTGYFLGTVDFDPGSGVFNLVGNAMKDGVFALKLNGMGGFVWAQLVDLGSGNDVAVDGNGNIYITGTYVATFTGKQTKTGPAIPPLPAQITLYKLDNNGAKLWNIYMGGANWDFGNSLVVDAGGNIYTTGSFSGGNYITGAGGGIATFGSINLTSNGENDVYIAKVDTNGNVLWAKGIGGVNEDVGYSIAINSFGDIYTVGQYGAYNQFTSGSGGTVDFDPGAGTFNLTSAGASDLFISKLSGDATPTFADVPFDHPLHDYIEALYASGYTAGCSTSPLMYCPDTILDRAQSAVFMLRGAKGSSYIPPAAPWNTFVNESWVGFEWAQPWAVGMYQEGLTTGCQTSPLKFCPENQLPRVEASIFGLKMKYGVNYTPPPATGTLFADFPSTDPSYWGIAWSEKAYIDGLLPACGTQGGKPMFCPGELVNRAWGAYLIVKAKGLPVP